ncbi:MAG: glycosyltransferase family 2 protein [Akkermansiaceae bacterium]
MNVVIPMAGRGSRLAEEALPKPLVEVAGKPLFAWSTRWIEQLESPNIIVIALEEHEERFSIREKIAEHLPNATCLLIPDVTAGQLCTVLLAEHLMDSSKPLLIAPCDTAVEGLLPIPDSLPSSDRESVKGLISVASMPGDRWSFADCDANWNVSRVTEKVRISDWASTGLYYFSDTSSFLRDAKSMVEENERTGGEFYVMPLYNRMLARDERVKGVPVKKMHDLGTPEALTAFEELI